MEDIITIFVNQVLPASQASRWLTLFRSPMRGMETIVTSNGDGIGTDYGRY